MSNNKKWNRKFRLLVQTNDTEVESKMEFLEITDPFTIQFTVSRDVNNSLNKFNCGIHNLNLKTRNKIFKDRLTKVYKRVIFQAGYGELVTIFQGDLYAAFSGKQGTEVVTSIDSQDGGYSTNSGFFSGTFAKGAKMKDIVNQAIQSMPVLKKGVIGGQNQANSQAKQRGFSYDGNPYDFIKAQYSGAFIDNEKVNVLADNEVIGAPILKFTSESGLLGTPQRQDSYITIDIMFEPYVQVGQLVELDSKIAPQYNGQFKVLGINHSGMISKTSGGAIKTSLSLSQPNQLGSWKEVKE